MPLAPGATFERYAIEALVGRGGMGEVYKAVDTRLHRAVALKVLRSDKDADDVTTAGGVQRLLREARAAAAFNHANSVSIYELGEAEGIPYIAMEYVVGCSLRAFIGDRGVPLETKVGWLVDVARALWAAHKAGLVHRDVKPGNIMVSEEGVVKVLDFGLAKAVTKVDPHAFQTLIGQVLGTPRYMAPEQLEGAAADARSDQFAFGVVAYELLSGTYPGGPLAGAPAPLDSVEPAIPAELSRAILRMMARDPAERFPTMDDAAKALRDCVPSVRNLHVPPSGEKRKRKTTSDAPTMEQRIEQQPVDQSGAVSIDIPLSQKANTLPLPTAVGAELSRRIGTSPLQSRAPTNRTLPIAQQAPVALPPAPATPRPSVGPRTPPGFHPSTPPSAPRAAGHLSPMAFASGIVSVEPHATPRRAATASGGHAPARLPSAPTTVPRAAKRSVGWIVALIVVVVLGLGGGALLAWTLW